MKGLFNSLARLTLDLDLPHEGASMLFEGPQSTVLGGEDLQALQELSGIQHSGTAVPRGIPGVPLPHAVLRGTPHRGKSSAFDLAEGNAAALIGPEDRAQSAALDPAANCLWRGAGERRGFGDREGLHHAVFGTA